MHNLKNLIGKKQVQETSCCGISTSFSQPQCHRKKIFLCAGEKVKRVFTPAPFVPFRSGYSLKNHLVRAKVCPLIRLKGTFCCGKSRCETYCKLKQTDSFESFVAQKAYKINHSFNCNSKCQVYLFSCEVCGNQYVHSIVDIDFDSGRISANVAKGTHQMVEHSTKTIFVNIFQVRVIMG